MKARRGERFTIYCAKAGGPETALRFKDGKRYASFTWVDDKIGYVVSGPADRDRLEAVTKTVYEQIDKAAREEGLSPHPRQPKSLRGSYGLSSRSFFISSLRSSSAFSGSITRTVASRSPVGLGCLWP